MQVLRTLGLVFLSAAIALAAGSASAVSYGFGQITSNGNPSVGSQLSVEVLAVGATQVSFTFTNTSVIESSITDIYFDDGPLLGIASITDSGGGVAFADPASPGNLPAGNTIDFNTTSGFSADSDSPVLANGVNSAAEFVTITFNLLLGKTFADTIAAIELALANPGVDVVGGLRIGLHVQGIDPDTANGSESFVTIPEPMGALLFGIGTLLAGAAIRRLS